jgi:hypothetical protein
LLKPDGVVVCPKKGVLGGEIAWARCVETHSTDAHGCRAYACEKQKISLLAIEQKKHHGRVEMV